MSPLYRHTDGSFDDRDHSCDNLYTARESEHVYHPSESESLTTAVDAIADVCVNLTLVCESPHTYESDSLTWHLPQNDSHDIF